MNKLNLKNINFQAPYTVHEREDKQHEFSEIPQSAIRYLV